MKFEQIEQIEQINGSDVSVPNGLPLIPLSGQKVSLVDVNPMTPATTRIESAVHSLDTTVDSTPEPARLLEISRLRKPRPARRNLNAELAKAEEISETVPSLATGKPVLQTPIQTAKDIEDELRRALTEMNRPLYAQNPTDEQRQLEVYPASVPVDEWLDGVALTRQSVKVFDETLTVQPVAPYGRFTPLGMALMLDHYQASCKMKYKAYVSSIDNVDKLINLVRQQNDAPFGVVVINEYGHAIPVMINKNKAYIAETFGFDHDARGVLSSLKTIKAIKKSNDIECHVFEEAVQSDINSCGSFAVKMLNKMMQKLDSFNNDPNSRVLTKLGLRNEKDEKKMKMKAEADSLFPELGKIIVHHHSPEIIKYTQQGEAYVKRMAGFKAVSDKLMLKTHFLKEQNAKPNGIIFLKEDKKKPGEFEQCLYNMTIDNARRKHASVIVPNRLREIEASARGVHGLMAEYTGAYLYLSSKMPEPMPVSNVFLESYKSFVRQETQLKRPDSSEAGVYQLNQNSLGFGDLEEARNLIVASKKPALSC